MNQFVRKATIEDAALIADISRQTFYETFAAQNSKADMDKFLNEQFTTAKLMTEPGQQENDFFLAYADDTLAGYVKLRSGRPPVFLRTKNALEIARLYAKKEMIGKGIGKLLMQTSIDAAKENNKEIIWLGVWEKNQHAIDFYTAWGFEKFDETDFILGNDLQRDWLMKKVL
ncbi:MAG: GNAT family N-acetyltransferase [Bacteroidota bacterium]